MYRYRDNSGATKKSLERAKLHLAKIGTPLYVRGYIYSGRYSTNHVGLIVKGTAGSARFSGFSWGYHGEGVRGTKELLEFLGAPKDEIERVLKVEWFGWESPGEAWRIKL